MERGFCAVGKKPHPVDLHVGNQVRVQRRLRGLSQSALAQKLGITFQQVQKYERGANRIGSSRLHRIAQVLKMPVSYFFEGLEADPRPTTAGGREADNMLAPEALNFVSAYNRIANAGVRRRVLALVKSLGRES